MTPKNFVPEVFERYAGEQEIKLNITDLFDVSDPTCELKWLVYEISSSDADCNNAYESGDSVISYDIPASYDISTDLPIYPGKKLKVVTEEAFNRTMCVKAFPNTAQEEVVYKSIFTVSVIDPWPERCADMTVNDVYTADSSRFVYDIEFGNTNVVEDTVDLMEIMNPQPPECILVDK